MGRIVHFEIHADDPERAVTFYTSVFGWQTTQWEGPEPYWLLTTGKDDEPGINGAIMKRQKPVTGEGVNGFVCTVDVSSIDYYMTKIKNSGGQIVADKMAVARVGWLAYCKDTEGNIFGIMQRDEAAA